MFSMKKVKLVLIALLILNLMDVALTWYAYTYLGEHEYNPVAAQMLMNDTFLVNKGGYMTIALLIMIGFVDYCSKRGELSSGSMRVVKAVTYVIICPITAMYLIAVITNILVIAGVLK